MKPNLQPVKKDMGKFRFLAAIFLIQSGLGWSPVHAQEESPETLSIAVKAVNGAVRTLSVTRVGAADLAASLKSMTARSTAAENQVSFHIISAKPNSAFRDYSARIIRRLNGIKSSIKHHRLDGRLSASVVNEFRRLFPKVSKGDVWLASIQVPLATGASLISFYLSDTPLPLSIMASSLLGLGSAGFQLFIEYWKDFLMKSSTAAGKLAKFHSVEVLFLMIPPTIFMAGGHMSVSSLGDFFKLFFEVNMTAVLTTFSQGLFEKELTELEKTSDKSHRFFGIDITNGGFLAASAVAVFSGVSMVTANTMGIENLKYLAWIGIGTLSSGGIAIHRYRTGRYIFSSDWRETFSPKIWLRKIREAASGRAVRCETSLPGAVQR